MSENNSNTFDIYNNLRQKCIEYMIEQPNNTLSTLCNITAAIYQAFKEIKNHENATNWVGFYIVRENPNISMESEILVLGPFQGKPAITFIEKGRGVCGTTWQNKISSLIENVHHCDNHLVCDPNSNAELVVPIIDDDGKVLAVLDLDSPHESGFNTIDQQELEKLCQELSSGINWSNI